jgi:23S rRNA (adenine2503-C2)-methyltransferase
MKKIPIKNLNEEEIYKFFEKINEPKFRAIQLNDAIYKKKISAFEEISNFSPKLIEKLNSNFLINALEVEKVDESADGSKKILYKTFENEKIETVFLPNRENQNREERNTVCISTMVGCPVNCKFCATAKLGFKKNLSISEIIDQIFLTRKTTGQYIDNLVFMGMGEPLLNFENLAAAIELILKNNILNKKAITISSVGIPEKVIALANKELKIKLAISLHSPFDEIRQKLIPISKNYSIEDLLKSLDFYYKTSRIPLTFEYILFKNVNDRDEDVKRLSRISHRFPSKINLIPFNDISFIDADFELEPANSEEISTFQKKLYEEDVMAIIRKSQGNDIAAACGQLAFQNSDISDNILGQSEVETPAIG